MSLARQFFHEMRPLFRMLEEPFGRTPSAFGAYPRSMLDDPFFRTPVMLQPAVDVTEEGNKYVIEAELPGVKKENVNVRIGDGGRSVTIEGKVVSRRGEPQSTETSSATTSAENATTQSVEGSTSTAVTQAPESSAQLSIERSFTSNASFTRTVYLPRAIDTGNVSAKLTDGVLTVTVAKAEDPASAQVNVE
ncbi:HSP20-like chaperone [Fomitopsis serialis]|uniref:HSP20-like chaperone n=1 Tax=Fomitopsis serialis TaxID=139415 RepID=UPI002008E33C|nr:HSP20-like chaperone [Neoantrodia serialis]KAH9936285.1 HSP20-like chaperone [Neoantrodia serialis]